MCRFNYAEVLTALSTYLPNAVVVKNSHYVRTKTDQVERQCKVFILHKLIRNIHLCFVGSRGGN